MAREIKFRAWNTFTNTMGPALDFNTIVRETPKDSVHEDVIHMQFTGLKDKNGVEIWEGDIVRHSGTNSIASIVWHGTMAGFIYQRPEDGQPHVSNDRWGELFRIYTHSEVIGNIYENPELLKVSHD